ncbi:MAG: hypothetical protein Q7T55_21215 [Solirubrobacteraceae bacterium]|nr:hypothetical protein [Solirubrobacteraceae bacterium]
MDRPPATPDEPAAADLALRGLDAVDDVQRRVRDVVVTVMPRVSLTRVVLVPSYLLLIGSSAAPLRDSGFEFVLNVVYGLLLFSGVTSEQLRLQRLGLTAMRRRYPRGGRRQFVGLWATLAAIVVTAYGGGYTDIWWLGLPVGLVAAAVTVAARGHWISSFPVALPTRLPGAEPTGPFQDPAALRLAAALALADRVRPTVLEESTGLPAGALEEGVGPLARARLARVLAPDPEGRTVLTMTGRGRRVFRRECRRLRPR